MVTHQNGLTSQDVREIVGAVFARRFVREIRSENNCRYVRKLMREREPRIYEAYERAVRNATPLR